MRSRLQTTMGIVLSIVSLAAPPPADAQPVPGMALRNKAAEVHKKAIRRQLPSLRATLAHAFPHRLAALSPSEFPADVPDGQVLSGVHRALEPEVMRNGTWHPLPGGGRVWRLAIQSPGAAGIRLRFENFHAGTGRVWLYDGSGDESEIMGAYTGGGPWQDGEFWSDYVMADVAIVEYEPDGAAEEIPFRIAGISHLLPDSVVTRLAAGAGKPGFRELAAAAIQRNDSAASCNLDVSCYPAWSEVAKAVAHIVYEKDGGSFVCSGTLMNSRGGTGIPYLLTTDHCVSSNTVARTVQSFWGYQTSRCNGPAVIRRDAQRVLGATYLGGAGVSQGDYTLLRLTEAPPDAWFAGWNPAELDDNTQMTAIHHPAGEHKRISFGVSAASRLPAFYRVNFTNGVVQPGSSGSGVFSPGGQLRGVLSSGPKLDSPEEYCSVSVLPVNYGRFSVIYNGLRDFFEDRAETRPANPGPPPATGTPTALTSGTAQNFTIDGISQPRLLNGSSGYSIRVPEGATRLEVQLITDTPGADLDLYVRFGQDVAQSGSRVVTDYRADGPTGNETLTITPASTPALRAGTYYVGIGVFTPGARIIGRVLATVSTGPASTGSGLTSGVAHDFSIGPVNVNTLFTDPAYRIMVPEGATSLEIEVRTTTRGADVDLYVSHNTEVALQGSRVVADHVAETDSGDERIIITRDSKPPLRAGTYYVALGLFTHRVVVTGTIRATVRMPSPAPAAQVRLTAGQPQPFRFDAVDRPTLFYGDYSFTVDVPQNARRLVVQLNTATPEADLDLFVRHGADNVLENGRVMTDHSSEGPTGAETITITPDSAPALRPGRYYISFVVFTAGKAVSGTVTATVQTGNAGSQSVAGAELTSGQAARFSLPPESVPFLHNGDRSFTIDVPAGASSLTVELRSTVPAVDVDLFVRHGEDVDLDDEGVIADYWSETESGNETIVISNNSNPPLKPGKYYLTLAVYTTDVAAAGMLTATVERGFAPPSDPAARPISIGSSEHVELPSVEGPTLFTGDYGYYFDIPSGSGRLEVEMRTETAGSDVDLYLRYGAEPEIVNGRVIADHRGFEDTGDETVVVDSLAVPPLRPGRYYLGFAQYTENVASNGRVVVRYDGPAGLPVEQTLSLPMPGPKGRMGMATRIPSSAKYNFEPLKKKRYTRAAQ